MIGKKYIAHTLKDLPDIADELIPLLRKYPVVAFYGAMGVGKTTFIKALCQQLEVSDPVTSPSFAIINEYLTKNGQSIFHFDFYRLRNDEELFDLGYEDYFYNGEICLLEWPEKIANYLPNSRLDIHLEEMADGTRIISASHPD